MPRSTPESCFVDVAPLAPLPLGRVPFFTYVSDQRPSEGSLVSIPIGRREAEGIVLSVRPKTGRERRVPYRYRPVGAVSEAGLLTVGQLALARHMADAYLAPLGRTLVHFIPPARPKRALRRASDKDTLRPSGKPLQMKELSPSQKQARRFLMSKEARGTPCLLTGPSGSGKTELLLAVLSDMTKKGGQALLLLPEVGLAEYVYGRALAYAGEGAVLLHSRLADGAYRAAWERVRTGEARLIVGTRQAVCAPFTHLRAVAVDEEQDESYKQWDMAPRYDARDVAAWLAARHGARLVCAAALPRLETWYAGVEGRYRVAKLDPLPGQRPLQVTVANLREERYRRNFSALSGPLAEALDRTLAGGGQAVLFINHQGLSRFSVCEGCRTPLRCPDCGRVLVPSQSGEFVCLRCPYRSGPFIRCPVCRGQTFRHIGFGTERVEREVRKRFPRVNVARVDRATLASHGRHMATLREFLSGRIDILIGTQSVIKGFHLPGVSLVGIIDADNLLQTGDFRAEEKLLQKLASAAGRAGGQAQSDPRFVIQSFHPENPLLGAFLGEAAETFYRALLPDREAFGYPPFGRLVLIRGTARSEATLDRAVGTLMETLSRLSERYPGLKVLPSGAPLSRLRGGRVAKQFLCRWEAGAPLPDEAERLLKKLSHGPVIWTFDIDPVVFS